MLKRHVICLNDFERMLYEHFSKEKADALLALSDTPAVYGLRMNRLKQVELDFDLMPSPLNEKMLIPKDFSQTVTHPYHHAGVYYIQDPSASLAVEFMKLQEDDHVLDLCAAPGGKSTEILNQIPKGFLLANEINPKRNRRLQANLQRWGHENVAVSLASSELLAQKLPARFDKIIVDAPCSAEGLFRRKKDFIQSYRKEDPHRFVPIQKQLLEDAYRMLKPGGSILYATCTLNPYENEGVVKSFLADHPDCYLEMLEHPMKTEGFDGMKELARFFPSEHGEGHFMAKIVCPKEACRAESLNFHTMRKKRKQKIYLEKDQDLVSVLFDRPALNEAIPLSFDMIPYQKHHRNQKLQYFPAISRYPQAKNLLPSYELSLQEAYAYLHGLTLQVEHEDAWVIMTYQGMALGLAKVLKSRAKNYYPKAERNRFSSYP